MLQIIISVLIALGIFEAVKKILLFFIDNTVIKRNLEIREIATRVQDCLSWLKLSNFEQPFAVDITSQLYSDIAKMEEEDKELADNIMVLINYPRMTEFLYKNGGEKNRELITDYHNELTTLAPKLNKKLNKLRYKPLLKIGKLAI